MLYAPSRGIWQPSRELLPWLTPAEWERGTRPWHKSDTWRPGRQWCPSLDTQRRMHALGIIFPGAAQVRREVTAGTAAVGPSAAPMHFYRLEEASGNRVDSGTVGGFDLTPTGTPGNATGLIGNGVNFTSGMHLDWGGTQFALGSGVSVTAWIWGKFTSFQTSECGWISQNNAGFTQGWFLGDNGTGGKPLAYACTISNGLKSAADSSASLTISTWFFLVFRYDSSAKTAYVRTNDTTQASVSTISDLAAGGVFAIGNGQEGIFPHAVMDAAAYFNSSLSSADVTAGWNAGAGREWYSGAWH
jgi:hypothetical protein